MLVPHRPEIKTCIRQGAVVNSVEGPDPGKAGLISSFEEGTSSDGPQLLKSLWKISVEILSKMCALTLFGDVAAELDGLKVAELRVVFRGWFGSGLSRLRQCEVASCGET